MGAVSIDIHKKERDLMQLSLSSEDVIRYLIEYRDKVDIYFGEKTDFNPEVANNTKELNQELVVTYASLDKLIAECSFNEKQLRLIHLLSIGYTVTDVEETQDDFSKQNAQQIFGNICKTIARQNEYNWKMVVHKTVLDTPTKICTVCKTERPSTSDFYGKDAKNKDGLNAKCKKCR